MVRISTHFFSDCWFNWKNIVISELYKSEVNKVADCLSCINSDTNEINYLTQNYSVEMNENEEDSLLVQTVHYKKKS